MINLPSDIIINHIAPFIKDYISYRNGKFIMKIQNINTTYKFISNIIEQYYIEQHPIYSNIFFKVLPSKSYICDSQHITINPHVVFNNYNKHTHISFIKCIIETKNNKKSYNYVNTDSYYFDENCVSYSCQ
jgi:hypothetical protein